MPETFTPVPSFQAPRQRKPNVSRIQFGDGYEQRAAKGMNTIVDTWNLNFLNRTTEEADEIDDFLTARSGVEAFLWTAPGEDTAKLWVCDEWSRTLIAAGIYTIAATFRQVHEPS